MHFQICDKDTTTQVCFGLDREFIAGHASHSPSNLNSVKGAIFIHNETHNNGTAKVHWGVLFKKSSHTLSNAFSKGLSKNHGPFQE
ncbi:13347_t:CDS:2 [Acaulospora morrowiae]|uniref:13347_t:CDS:1 n=1 Tax=Acaulospora morrowiae TaxID=94023 RepID=A0A9N8WHV6_9GLOM|nr:13347_t:CDS:2 [Acaulospora morrowiae]